MGRELIFNIHGIGTPHDGVMSEEAFFWIKRDLFTALLDAIAVTRARSRLPVIVTFDDGNVSDWQVALPELVKRKMQAIFFVCAARIGEPNYLNRSALLELLAAGMEIGTHGMNHRNWRGLSEAELDSEVTEARHMLEHAGATVTKAAIPFGSYDRRVLRRLRREGFQCVYSSDRGLAKAHAWLKPRETVDSTWNQEKIEEVLLAKPSMLSRLRRNLAVRYKSMR